MQEKIKWSTFLKDVLICSLGAYGGPEAHYGVFTERMITKKQYITEEELGEYIALTSILPGPSSTQTIISIGYKVGGPVLGFLTLLVWALPIVLVMTGLSFMYQFFINQDISTEILRYIGPMAVGFIGVAAYRIGRKVIRNYLHIVLFVLAIVVTFVYRNVWVFPSLLLFGGIVSLISSKEEDVWHKVSLKPPYQYLIIFGVFAFGLLLGVVLFDGMLLWLFERFYRYGYLIIGGGQVVVPYMYTDLVEVNMFMSSEEFLTGFGLVQGLPGPMFSFSAYAGGMAAREGTALFQIVGGLLSAFAIFLPGVLLIYFVLPVWEQLKAIKGLKIALKGITVVAAGLIASAGIVLMRESGLSLENFIVVIVTITLLLSKKVPAPIIVVLALLAGALI